MQSWAHSGTRWIDTGRTSVGRPRLKRDGTRAETRFGLSGKRTSPFKSAGESVQSTTGSRGVRISGSNAGYTMFWGRVKDYWLPTPLACFPITSPPVRHRVPSGFSWALPWSELCCYTCGYIVVLWLTPLVESSWNVMAHGDAQEKWRGNCRME